MDTIKTGAYLAMLRKAKGATQQEIADQLGVSNKTVSKWESGGGLPDITVLPALAELYGVTADDLLAGETLTDRRRSALKGETAALRKRLLARLRLRFDVCFIISLALAGIAFMRTQYVTLAAIPLSVAADWVGYILVAHPIRYGGVKAEAALWQSLYRKLLAASVVQWCVLMREIHLGEPDVVNIAFFEKTGLPVLHYTYDQWTPLLFFAGLSAVYLLLRWGLRRTAGPGAELLPRAWRRLLVRLGPWLIWAAVFFFVWRWADGRYEQAAAPWRQKYGTDVMRDSRFDEWWPRLREKRDAELLPLFRTRQRVLAAGGVSGLGLLGWTAWSGLRRKKTRAPLADPQK